MTNEKIVTTIFPYCEETHKRILGVCSDKNGNEFVYQPERSKREDSECIITEEWGCLYPIKVMNAKEMRCSEHCGDTVRPAEKIGPPRKLGQQVTD